MWIRTSNPLSVETLNIKDKLEGRQFLVLDADEDLEDRMSADEAILESKAKIASSFLSRSFDVVMIMSFV